MDIILILNVVYDLLAFTLFRDCKETEKKIRMNLPLWLVKNGMEGTAYEGHH